MRLALDPSCTNPCKGITTAIGKVDAITTKSNKPPPAPSAAVRNEVNPAKHINNMLVKGSKILLVNIDTIKISS